MATKKSTTKRAPRKAAAKKSTARKTATKAPEATPEPKAAAPSRPLDKHELYKDRSVLNALNKVYDDINGQLDKHNDLIRYHLVQIQGEIEAVRNAYDTSQRYARPEDSQ